MTVYSYLFNKVPTVKVEIDWNNDGLFNNSNSDVTQYVMSWDSQIGYQEQFQLIANKGTARIVLDNSTNPSNGLKPFNFAYGTSMPGIGNPIGQVGYYYKVRISFYNFPTMATPEATTPHYDFASRTFDTIRNTRVFTGYIKDITCDDQNDSTQTVTLDCFDLIGVLDLVPFAMPNMTWVPPHAASQIILDTCFGDGTSSYSWLWLRSQPSDGDWFQFIYGLEPAIYRYTFKTTLSGASNEIKIGATLADSSNNAFGALSRQTNTGNWATTMFIPEYMHAISNTADMIYFLASAPSSNFNTSLLTNCITGNNLIWGGSYFGMGMGRTVNGFGSNASNGNFYALSEASGTTVVDEGPNSANATYTGAGILYLQGSPCPVLNSMKINAVGASASKTNAIPSETFTVKFLFKKGGTIANGQVLFDCNNGVRTPFRVEYRTGNNLAIVCTIGTFVSTSSPLSTAGWYEIMVERHNNNNAYSTVSIYCAALGTQPVLLGSVTANGTDVAGVPYSWVLGNNSAANAGVDGYFSALGIYPQNGEGINGLGTGKNWNPYWNYWQAAYAQNSPQGTSFFGANATSYGDSLPAVISTGSQTASQYLGAGWDGKSTTALKAMEEVTRTEFGRFFVTRLGQPYWLTSNDYFRKFDGYLPNGGAHSGHQIYGAHTARGKLKKTTDHIHNAVEVKYTPRPSESAASSTVCLATGAIRLEPSWEATTLGKKTISLPYLDATTGSPVSVSRLILPLAPNTHFTVNRFDNFNGEDVTTKGYVTFAVTVNSSNVVITMTNTTSAPLYVKILKIEGYTVTIEKPTSIYLEDATSIATYGKKYLSYEIPQDVTPAWAYSIANALLTFYKNPYFYVDGDVNYGNAWIVGDLNTDESATTAVPFSGHWWHLLDVEVLDAISLFLAPKGPISDSDFQDIQQGIVTGIKYHWTPASLTVSFSVENIFINLLYTGPGYPLYSPSKGFLVLDDTTYGKVGQYDSIHGLNSSGYMIGI